MRDLRLRLWLSWPYWRNCGFARTHWGRAFLDIGPIEISWLSR